MKNLTKAMMITLLISLLFSCVRIKKEKRENQVITSHAYKKGVYGERVIINKNNIVALQQILNKKLSKNWFVFANKYSLTVYYGKSCQEKFIQNVRSTTPGAPDKISRLEFFNGIGPDSVCYSPGVSLKYSEYKSKEEYKSRYPNNAIVKFEIKIRKEWKKAKYEQVLNRNDSMKKIVTEYLNENPRKFIVSEFSDYRFWIPLKNSFNFLPNKLDFQRLPYYSVYFQNSIFLIQDKPYFAAFTSIEGNSKIGRER